MVFFLRPSVLLAHVKHGNADGVSNHVRFIDLKLTRGKSNFYGDRGVMTRGWTWDFGLVQIAYKAMLITWLLQKLHRAKIMMRW